MPKVKFFVWRLINRFIPVCSKLLKKGIQADNIFLVCGDQDKLLFHVFFACKLSSEVWKCCYLNGMCTDPSLWEGLDGWSVLF